MDSKKHFYTLKEASFVTSSQNLKQSPPPLYTEVAFLGRSNVGKSTLINCLCGQKNLAKSSATPGKTQLINFFLTKWQKAGEEFCLYFVDLPGFGYAKVSKTTQKQWQKNLSDFLQKRDSIRLFVHLIDARHEYLANDLVLRQFLKSFLRPNQCILEVFTKCDKLKQNDFSKLQKKHSRQNVAFSSLPKSSHTELLCDKIANLALKGGL